MSGMVATCLWFEGREAARFYECKRRASHGMTMRKIDFAALDGEAA